MSKHPRRLTDDAEAVNNLAAGAEDLGDARPADHSRTEPKLVVSGAAFQELDAWIDRQLEELVGRWIHTAAPAASSVRRVVPKESRPREEA